MLRLLVSALFAAVLLGPAPAASAQVSFAPPSDLFGREPTAVAISDLDRDGAGDVVMANRGSDDVGFFPGDGFGGFGLPGVFNVGDAPRGLAVGDFDGDAKRDLAVSDNDSGDVAVLAGDGTGCFCAPVFY